MTRTLLIHILEAPDQPAEQRCAWRLFGDSSESEDTRVGTISQLWDKVTVLAPDTVILALPSECVLTHMVDFSQAKLKQSHSVLLYDVEPCLSLPLNDWHSIELPKGGGSARTIACATKVLVSAWCAWLDLKFPNAEHTLISESWLLPRPGLWQNNERCLLTSSHWQAWVCHPNNKAPLMRQLQVAGLPDGDQRHSELTERTVLDSASNSKLNRLPNLRSGIYAQDRASRWIAPAVAALLLIAACLGVLNWQVGSIKADLVAEKTLLQRQEVALFRELFPTKARIVDVRKQLTQEVNSLLDAQESQTKPSEFLPRLAYIAEIVGRSETPFTLASIKYDQKSDNLTLYLSGESLSSLQTLADSLRNNQFQATLSSARESDVGYAAIVEMSEQ